MPRPITTLFLLTSVDGKISTGDTDAMDFDRDLKTIAGVREGLPQYYALEKQTDLASLNTGRVMAKIGVNDRTDEPARIPVTFVIVDNEPHLTAKGVEYLSKWVERLLIVTTNPSHPSYLSSEASAKGDASAATNVMTIPCDSPVDFPALFLRLGEEFGIDRLTVQSGGTLNAALIRAGLIDHLSIVVAPVLVGGKGTSSLVDGESLHSVDELGKLRALALVSTSVLKDSYLHLRYDVRNA